MTASPEPVAAERAGLRVPDFFIVGHAKCGTTALYEGLRGHSQIFMSEVKEPQFFARSERTGEGAAGRLSETGRRPLSFQDYLSLYAAARPEQRIGDGSTFYLWSRDAPARIAKAQPGAKIIAIFREPSSFLRSLHLQLIQNGVEPEKDLRRAMELEGERRQGRQIPRNSHWPEALFYSERLRYKEQLERFDAVFPREQMLVLIYDDFLADNEGTIRRVLRFLDVEENARLEVPKANLTVDVRSPGLKHALGRARAGEGAPERLARRAIKSLSTSRLRAKVLYPLRKRVVFRAPPPPDETLMGELRSRYRSEVVALGERLDRDLVTLWGYDHPA
jgi:Sulfotransferase family